MTTPLARLASSGSGRWEVQDVLVDAIVAQPVVVAATAASHGEEQAQAPPTAAVMRTLAPAVTDEDELFAKFGPRGGGSGSGNGSGGDGGAAPGVSIQRGVKVSPWMARGVWVLVHACTSLVFAPFHKTFCVFVGEDVLVRGGVMPGKFMGFWNCFFTLGARHSFWGLEDGVSALAASALVHATVRYRTSTLLYKGMVRLHGAERPLPSFAWAAFFHSVSDCAGLVVSYLPLHVYWTRAMHQAVSPPAAPLPPLWSMTTLQDVNVRHLFAGLSLSLVATCLTTGSNTALRSSAVRYPWRGVLLAVRFAVVPVLSLGALRLTLGDVAGSSSSLLGSWRNAVQDVVRHTSHLGTKMILSKFL